MLCQFPRRGAIFPGTARHFPDTSSARIPFPRDSYSPHLGGSSFQKCISWQDSRYPLAVAFQLFSSGSTRLPRSQGFSLRSAPLKFPGCIPLREMLLHSPTASPVEGKHSRNPRLIIIIQSGITSHMLFATHSRTWSVPSFIRKFISRQEFPSRHCLYSTVRYDSVRLCRVVLEATGASSSL